MEDRENTSLRKRKKTIIMLQQLALNRVIGKLIDATYSRTQKETFSYMVELLQINGEMMEHSVNGAGTIYYSNTKENPKRNKKTQNGIPTLCP